MTILDRFHSEYHAFHGISQARAREQLNLLRQFEVFIGVPLDQATDAHIRAFLTKLVADGFHPNTVRKKHLMLRPFYGWAFDVGLISAETLMRMQRVRNPRGSSADSLPRPYERKEIERFWRDLDESWPTSDLYLNRWRKGRSRWPRVYKTMMHAQIEAVSMLALHAGMRRDEIYHAPLDDIHYDNAYVVVRFSAAKNGTATVQPREVPMTAALSTSLQKWFDLRAEIKPKHDRPWLSLTHTGPRKADWYRHPMSHDRFSELLGTVGKGYELHRLRHTAATEWLRAGVPIEQVSRLLGHARIQQTLAYAQIIKTDLEKSMGKAAADFQTAVGRAA
jgi:integrase